MWFRNRSALLSLGIEAYFLNEDLQVDLDFYYNRYDDFIAQVEMNIPKTDFQDSIPFYMNDRRKQERYRMWTNSKTTAYNYGAGLGILYNVMHYFKFKSNLTYAKLQRSSNNDGLEDGFNTPEWIINLSLMNDNIYKDFGFNITYRWQSNYYWQSFLVNGNVQAFQTIDAQLSKQIDKLNLKIGGSNIFNGYYQSFLGGPSIGGFYYVSVVHHISIKK